MNFSLRLNKLKQVIIEKRKKMSPRNEDPSLSDCSKNLTKRLFATEEPALLFVDICAVTCNLAQTRVRHK